MDTAVKRPSAHVVGDLAQSQLTVALQLEGCAVGSVSPDYGEDLAVELPESGEVKGARILVQVKGTAGQLGGRDGTIHLARVPTSALRKWEGTLTPVAVVLWNTRENVGYYTFVNTPTSFLCRYTPGRKTKSISAPRAQVISQGRAGAFVEQAFLAHRMNAELLRGVLDLDDGPGTLPEAVIERNAEMLVTIGLLRREQTPGGVGWSPSEQAKDAYIGLLEDLSERYPSWPAREITRRAAVVLVERAIAVRPESRLRLTHSGLRIIWPMLDRPGMAEIVASWGHALDDKGGAA